MGGKNKPKKKGGRRGGGAKVGGGGRGWKTCQSLTGSWEWRGEGPSIPSDSYLSKVAATELFIPEEMDRGGGGVVVM